MAENILNHIGNTPLVKVRCLSTGTISIYAKLEYFNPGGSVKDRPSLFMIEKAEREGKLKKDTVIIEPTAGNTGVGIAVVAAVKGYKCVFVVPERFSVEKQELMKALGARLVFTPTKKGMEGAIEKAFQLNEEIPNSIVLQQFSNPANLQAHYETTGPEIYNQLNGNVDVIVIGAGTGGTFMGAAKFLKEKIPHLYSAAVEPRGSILGGKPPGPHKIEGIGVDNLKTSVLIDKSYIDEIVTVKDEEAHGMLKKIASSEGMLIGSSAGAAAFACFVISRKIQTGDIKINKNKSGNINLVTVFPDSSERYLSKNIYGDFNEWKI